MTTLRMTAEAFEWFAANSQVWWSAKARWALDRVAPGLPGVEVDDKGDPTGFVVFADPRIDAWDQIILDVCLAGMAYAQSLGPVKASELVAYQAAKDLTAYRALLERYQAGDLTRDDVERAVKLEVIRQAGVLGVPLPEFDDDLRPLPPKRPAESATKAEWVTWATAVGLDPTGTKAELIERAVALVP